MNRMAAPHVAAFRRELRELLRFCFAGDAWQRAGVLLLTGIVFLTWQRHSIYLEADDAFYYYQSAINFWRHGFVSYDGITPTNGVQPLWFWIVSAMAAPLMATGLTAYLPHCAMALQFFLALAAQQVYYGIFRSLFRSAHVCALLAFLTGGLSLALFDGMEGILSIVFAPLLVAYAQMARTKGAALQPLLFGVLSAIVLYARLDNAIYLLAFYALLVPLFGLKRLIYAGLLLTALASPYFAWNQISEGSPVPISGEVKRFWSDLGYLEQDGKVPALPGPWTDSRYARQQTKEAVSLVAVTALQTVDRVCLNRFGMPWDTQSLSKAPQFRKVAAASIAFLIAGALVGVALVWCRGRLATAAVPAMGILAGFVFFAFQMWYYLYLQWAFFGWYGGIGKVCVSILFCVLGFSWIAWLGRRVQIVLCWGLIAVWCAGWSWSNWHQQSSNGANYPQTTCQGLCETLADYVRKNTPEDTRIGAWTAGVTGWEAERDTVNLEGLVGDDAMLARSRTIDIAGVLNEKKIDYIAQHFSPVLLAMNPTKSRGSSSFNHIRLRPLIDFPEAYESVFATRNKYSNGWVWRVKHDALATLLEERDRLAAAVDGACVRVPAEDGTLESGVKVVSHRATRQFAVKGKQLTVAAPSASWQGAAFARVLRPKPGDAALSLRWNGKQSDVAFAAKGCWQTIPLSANDSPTVQVELLNLVAAQKKDDPSDYSVYVDELYFVSTEKIGEATAAFAALDAFVDRTATHAPFPGTENAH